MTDSVELVDTGRGGFWCKGLVLGCKLLFDAFYWRLGIPGMNNS